MRIRSIQPGMWSQGSFLRLSFPARLFFLALHNVADDAGALEEENLELKARLMPADNVDIPNLLAELEEQKLIFRYERNDKRYLLLRNFRQTQHPQWPWYDMSLWPKNIALPEGFSLPNLRTDHKEKKTRGRERGERRRKRRGEPKRRGVEKAVEKAVERSEEEKTEEIGGSDPGGLEIDKTRLNSLSEGGEGEEVKSASLRSAGARVNPVLPPLDNPDPLAAHPQLLRFYPDLLKRIAEAHPHAQLPAPGTTDGLARKTLANLVTLDGYPEREVVEALAWLFQSDDEQPVFWRTRLVALSGLRRTRDGMTKFARIHEQWQQRNGHGKQKYDWCEPEYRDDDPFTRDGSA
jgi:hypothetical protein